MRIFLFLSILFWFQNTRSQTIISIELSGNEKTDKEFLLRFVEVKPGDTLGDILDERIAQTINNLKNTGLFNTVDVEIGLKIGEVQAVVVIAVTERWYLWVYPQATVYETNFNTWLKSPNLRRVSYGFDLVKFNVGGKGKTLSLKTRLGYLNSGAIEFAVPNFKNTNHGVSADVSFNQ